MVVANFFFVPCLGTVGPEGSYMNFHGYLFCPSDNMSADMSTIELNVIPTETGHATDSSDGDE